MSFIHSLLTAWHGVGPFLVAESGGSPLAVHGHLLAVASLAWSTGPRLMGSVVAAPRALEKQLRSCGSGA